MSGRRASSKPRRKPTEHKTEFVPDGNGNIDYAYLGTFTPGDTDILLKAFKENSIPCSVELLDKLKTVLRSYGWSQAEFNVFVHPEYFDKALTLRDSLLPWEMRLRDVKSVKE